MRILSATHKNLADLVATGRFREDLYYRINVIELRVPPLRERSERHRRILPRRSCSACAGAWTPRAAGSRPGGPAALQSYAFPGNVRELENILERALTLCTGGRHHAGAHAAAHRRPTPSGGAMPTPPIGDRGCRTAALGEQLEDIEREAIVKALEQTRYNKTAAAKLLGMTFRALRYRIKKLGIE